MYPPCLCASVRKMIEHDGMPDAFGAGEGHVRKRKRSLTEARQARQMRSHTDG